ncbi:MAG: hypothetical protein SR3Q1_10885 [Quinella sp. 3Q1]|nr:hypothetical protein [Quinella sp. 3Q1]MBR6887650.1 hypothetical protein [Selenomonadaceae bacterium]
MIISIEERQIQIRELERSIAAQQAKLDKLKAERILKWNWLKFRALHQK